MLGGNKLPGERNVRVKTEEPDEGGGEEGAGQEGEGASERRGTPRIDRVITPGVQLSRLKDPAFNMMIGARSVIACCLCCPEQPNYNDELLL